MNARSAFAVLVAVLTVTSVVAVPVAAGSASTGAATSDRLAGTPGVLPAATPASQTLDATDEVKIWERAIFPLRADPDDAAFTVDNAAWDAELEGVARKSLQKDEVGVYEINDKITLTFDDSRAVANKQLAGEPVQLVAARLEADRSATLDSFSTLDDLKTLLTQQNANDNASFEVVKNANLDSDGERTFSYTPTEPGQYLLFVVTTANGSLSATGGDLSMSGDNVTVVGVDGIAVRRGAPSVKADKQKYKKGDDVTFTVDTKSTVQTAGNVSHAILLYDEDTYTDAEFNLVADDHLTADFDVSENVTLEHSIDSVNGEQRAVDGVTAFGFSAGPGTSSGSNSLDSVLNFLVQNSNLSASLKPKTTSTDTTELDASMTAVNGTAKETIVVETRSDWRAACYRWIHVATDDTGTELASKTGTVGVGTNCKKSSGPPPSRGRDRDDSTVDTPGTTVTTRGNVDVTVEDEDGTTSVTVRGTTPGTSVNIQRSAGQVDEDLQNQGAALESMETDFDGETEFDMQISNTPDKPDPSVPDPPSDKGTVGYINVDHSASDEAVGEVRFNFRVTQARLDERGISPDEVVLYRYSGGEWTALETEPAGTAPDGSLRFRAVSPGLSVFAIGSRAAQVTTTAEPTTTEAPPETTTEAPPETTAPPGGPPPVAEPGGFGDLTLVLVIAVLVVLVGGGLWYYRERRE